MVDSGANWEFHLDGGPKPKIKEVPKMMPWIGTSEAWEQYSDDRVYHADKLVRAWIAEMKRNSKWVRTAKLRRYRFSDLFHLVTGEEYDASKHSKTVHIYTRIFSYYSSRIQRGGSINGKSKNKTIYCISPKRLEKCPYSLKLRLEWFAERGEIPTSANMALPKDDLRIGHARNPRTEANMRKREAEGRRRYNERYADRNH